MAGCSPRCQADSKASSTCSWRSKAVVKAWGSDPFAWLIAPSLRAGLPFSIRDSLLPVEDRPDPCGAHLGGSFAMVFACCADAKMSLSRPRVRLTSRFLNRDCDSRREDRNLFRTPCKNPGRFHMYFGRGASRGPYERYP